MRAMTRIISSVSILHLLVISTSNLVSAFALLSPYRSTSCWSRSSACIAGLTSTRNDGLVRNRRRSDSVTSSVVVVSAAILPLEEFSQLFIVATTTIANSAEVSSTNDLIQQAFSVATFLPQPFWLLLIALPNVKFTKQVMGDTKVVTFFCLLHLFIVLSSILEPDGTAPMLEFADVFDPKGNPQGAMVHMMTYPNFVSEEWSHVLTWDLLVGRWIWLDGLRRGIFTGHSVLLTNLIGPPGLLLHVATCLLTGKGVVGNEALQINNDDVDQLKKD